MWASENGYAVIRLQYQHNPLRPRSMVLTFLSMGVAWLGSWFVEIQDEQGGIRHAYVRFPVRSLYFFPRISVPWGKIQIEWR